jgi:L-ascorbate metabolism protein UlaG (beta-lactamase superfamily)
LEIGKTGVRIEFLGNSGFFIRDGSNGNGSGKKIAIDPYNVSDNVLKSGKADIVLITHSHSDNCSIKDIEKIVDSESGSVVICPADCQSKIMKMEGIRMEVVEVGDKIELSGGVKIEVVPAYNKHKDYHPKSEGWVGFLIKIGSVVVYHAGDTDYIPEMQKLSGYGKHGNEFVALLPVSGGPVMNVEQAADAASVISPDLAIPMKINLNVEKERECAERFVELCKEMNIRAEFLEMV